MLPEKRHALFIIAGIVAALLVGASAGYFYGLSVGVKRGIVRGITFGREQLLEEQKSAQVAEIQKAANPYSQAKDVANPFKNSYTNPFAQ